MSWLANETIVSGVISGGLGMLGGVIGAMGAFYAAKRQMNKQFEKQDNDRLIELRIGKMNESLEMLNDFLNELNVMRGIIYDVELNYQKFLERRVTSATKSSFFKEDNYQKMQDKRHSLIKKKDLVKKNKYFLNNVVNLNDLYDETGNFIESYKKFIKLFGTLDSFTSIKISDLSKEFDERAIEMQDCYKKLNKSVSSMIESVEHEMDKILKV